MADNRRAKSYDPICKICKNNQICLAPCPPVTWINGKSPSKEPLISDICKSSDIYTDYNQTLAELINSRNITFEEIAAINPIRRRAITAMLIVDITVADIAQMLGCNRMTVWRSIKKGGC